MHFKHLERYKNKKYQIRKFIGVLQVSFLTGNPVVFILIIKVKKYALKLFYDYLFLFLLFFVIVTCNVILKTW